MVAKHLKPGMVVDMGDGLALCVSYETPAGSVPLPEARGLCEPGFVYLKHQQDDRWVQTHYFTYACLKLEEEITVNDSMRVQIPARTGRFLLEQDRIGMYVT